MSAAAADLNFTEGPFWTRSATKLGWPETQAEIQRAVGNHVISAREDFGVREISLSLSSSKAVWVLYFRRKKRPDAVCLLACGESPFSEVERGYFKEILEEK